jgi:hypothetical protein
VRRSAQCPKPLSALSQIAAHALEDQELAPGFEASLHGEDVEVTAVLQWKAVVAPLRDRWADKQVVRHADLLADPATIVWRPTAATGFTMKRRRYTSGHRGEMRAASDRRARADQERQAAAETAARQPAASAARRLRNATRCQREGRTPARC